MSTIKPYKEGCCHKCRETGDRSNKPLIGNLCYTKAPFHYQANQEDKARSRKPIPKISQAEKKRLAKYRPIKAAHLKEFPMCQYPGCTRTYNVSVHHGEGRIGKRLYRSLITLCEPEHHTWAELHPEEAKALGLSFSRLDKVS